LEDEGGNKDLRYSNKSGVSQFRELGNDYRLLCWILGFGSVWKKFEDVVFGGGVEEIFKKR
jgi:hypothetical protein